LTQTADWTFKKVKTGYDYDMKLYANTIYKYAALSADTVENAMN